MIRGVLNRVNKVPKEFADLKRFVEYHGICPAVHEIQVPWRFAAGSNSASASTHSGKVGSASASAAPYNEEPPRPELFIFEKTHARLTFVTTETEVGCNKDPKFETEGTIFCECESPVTDSPSHVVMQGCYLWTWTCFCPASISSGPSRPSALRRIPPSAHSPGCTGTGYAL